ncbi:unnamed protein product [Sphenostylis stenocarpa]|uniref:Albumin I chain a domain-containing protein n=1 Tax=Sphenostylis stenocarpa TaxID=92480 RepID=A0AA86V991_9FABA|nr:unnamed protein product [Sphenostylis stenocarpa]
MKSVESVSCIGPCRVTDATPCNSASCTCIPAFIFSAFGACGDGVESFEKTIDEHPNLCLSHHDCVKKGSGNFCALYPSQHVHYGWCFHSDSQALKSFLALSQANGK